MKEQINVRLLCGVKLKELASPLLDFLLDNRVVQETSLFPIHGIGFRWAFQDKESNARFLAIVSLVLCNLYVVGMVHD